jgi:hypothetical protein
VPVAIFLLAYLLDSVLKTNLEAFHKQLTIPGLDYTISTSDVRAPSVLAFFFLLYALFDGWAWHLPGISRLLALPDLRGEWWGKFRADLDPSVHVRISGRTVVSIQQHWGKMKIEFVGVLDELDKNCELQWSESESKMAYLSANELRYEYETISHGALPRHEGVAHCNIATLQGNYYTDKLGESPIPQHYGRLFDFERRHQRVRKPEQVKTDLKRELDEAAAALAPLG